MTAEESNLIALNIRRLTGCLGCVVVLFHEHGPGVAAHVSAALPPGLDAEVPKVLRTFAGQMEMHAGSALDVSLAGPPKQEASS